MSDSESRLEEGTFPFIGVGAGQDSLVPVLLLCPKGMYMKPVAHVKDPMFNFHLLSGA